MICIKAAVLPEASSSLPPSRRKSFDLIDGIERKIDEPVLFPVICHGRSNAELRLEFLLIMQWLPLSRHIAQTSLMFPFFHRLLRHFVTSLGIVSLGISGNDDCRVCFFPGLPPTSFEYLFYLNIIAHFLNFVLPYLRFTCICASHITSLTSRCIAYERNGHMNRKKGFTLAVYKIAS